MSAGRCISGPAVYLWELIMRADKSVSEETLQLVWSEIALLRQKVEQAERKKAASQVRLRSAIAAAQGRLQSRSKRSPSRSSCF
jgi:hypothetical protein